MCGGHPCDLEKIKKKENAFISRKRQIKFIITDLLMAVFGPTSIFSE